MTGLPRLALVCAISLAFSPLAATSQVLARVAPQSRLFLQESATSSQQRRHEISVAAEVSYTATASAHATVRGEIFARLAQPGAARDQLEVREALALFSPGPAAVDIGVTTVFWGVAESRHLVDIINQPDYREDIDGDTKLGQPMVRLGYPLREWGFLELFVMTGVRAFRFPDGDARPAAPLDISGRTRYDAERDRWSLDYAARWEHHVGALEWAVSYFHGTSREPQLLPGGVNGRLTLLPLHDLIDQVGVELQWTRGDWLWKAEGILRGGQGPTFGATTLGFEHTTWGVLGSESDLGVLAEFSYDGRRNQTFNIYDEDAFAGLRLSFNDVAGTELLAGVLADLESGSSLATIEASRRLGSGWTLELVGRAFHSDDPADPIHWFRRDDHLQTTVGYYF